MGYFTHMIFNLSLDVNFKSIETENQVGKTTYLFDGKCNVLPDTYNTNFFLFCLKLIRIVLVASRKSAWKLSCSSAAVNSCITHQFHKSFRHELKQIHDIASVDDGSKRCCLRVTLLADILECNSGEISSWFAMFLLLRLLVLTRKFFTTAYEWTYE